MKILLPINIDKWRSPIATLLRACAVANPQHEFYTYSNPETEEDRKLGLDFWAHEHIIKSNRFTIFQESFDLVHIASYTNKNLLAGVLAKLRTMGKARFLYSVNLELPEDCQNSLIHRCVNIIVDDYVSVSKAAAKHVLREVPHAYHGCIPNGFDDVYFDTGIDCYADLPDQVKALNGAPYVLNVAALEPRKHPEWIIKLAQRNPEINFVMAGWVVPGLGEPFLEMIKSCGLKNLHWIGHVNRSAIRALLRYASAFAFPSEREGLPLSVIEALGMGVPVVAQPKSSLPELITDPLFGKLITIDDEHSLENWSQQILDYTGLSVSERQQRRLLTRSSAVAKYSWSSIGRQYGLLYEGFCV